MNPFWRRYAAWFALLIAAVVPYLHTFDFGFTNYDDAATIVDLPLIHELSWQALPRFFAADIYSGLYEYMPLKNLSYAIDYALFGGDASGFRPQQLFWYAASVLATYLWLRSLLARLSELDRLGVTCDTREWLALGTTLLFALHPAHVESVSWLSGRKDLLSGTFVAAALGCGLAYSEQVRRRARGEVARAWPFGLAALVWTVLALLSKPTAIALPLLLLLQDFWVYERGPGIRASWLARAALHVPIGAATLAFAVFYERTIGAYTANLVEANPAFAPPFPVRIGEQLARYLQLVVDPSSLTPMIPEHRFSADAMSPIAWLGYLMALALAAALVLGTRRRHPLALAAWLFVLPILPSLLRPVWGQYVAGRYLFHALLGPVLALAWACARAAERHARLRRLLAAASCLVAVLWIGATQAYSRAFRSSAALWDYSIEVDPTYWRFYDSGARAALLEGHFDRALSLLERCLEVDARASQCAAPLGGLLLAVDPERGEELLLEVLPHDTTGTAHLRLAQYWSQHGRSREALALYERWLNGRIRSPDEFGALVDLAIADGQLKKARGYLRQQIAAASVLHPASPPPSAAVVRATERIGDPELAASAKRAAERCKRSDCFAAALGLHP
jgi:protein O-mannosyl-transferase